MSVVTNRVRELLQKAQLSGISPDERRELERLQTIREQVVQDPEIIAGRQQLRDVKAERAKTQQELTWLHLFRTQVIVDGVAKTPQDNAANRQIIRGWAQFGRGDGFILEEVIGPEWFLRKVQEKPERIREISWEVFLTPAERKRHEAAQLEKDRETFLQACKQLYIGDTDANFQLVREVLGPNFSVHMVQQAVNSGAARVSPATPQKIAAWNKEATEERNDYLVNRASSSELRAIANRERQQARQTAQQEQSNREIESAKARDAVWGNQFESLPAEIDKTAIKKASADQLKRWIRQFGSAAITQRLREAA
jgi:hypothetical protein